GAPRNLAVGSGYPSQSPTSVLGWTPSFGRGRSRTTSCDLSQRDQNPLQCRVAGSNLTSKSNAGMSVGSLKWMIRRLLSKTVESLGSPLGEKYPQCSCPP